jgi:hypothetical protein
MNETFEVCQLIGLFKVTSFPEAWTIMPGSNFEPIIDPDLNELTFVQPKISISFSENVATIVNSSYQRL